MLVFLSGPMDRTPTTLMGWITELEEAYEANPIVEGGVQFFSPQRAFIKFGTIPGSFAMRIREINEAAVRACSAFVLRYLPGVETWGCPMEAMLADQLHKPIIIWTPAPEPHSYAIRVREELPIYLQSCLEGPYSAITDRAEGVLQWIAKVDSAEARRSEPPIDLMGLADIVARMERKTKEALKEL